MNKEFFNIFKSIPTYIAVLQLENYNIKRYVNALVRMLKREYFPSKRKGISWTLPLKVSVFIACLLLIVSSFIISYTLFDQKDVFDATALVTSIIIIFLSSLFFFIHLALSTLILKPLEFIRTHRLITKAKQFIQNRRGDLIIIGIAGSYGKTTMKEALFSVISQEKKVLATKGNENTPIGISRRIISFLEKDHEVFIVEMGEHEPGDIKELCEITPPNHSIITGINEAHLERMGSIENTIATIFEIDDPSLTDAVLYINNDDEVVRKEMEKRKSDKVVKFAGKNNESEYSAIEIKEKFKEDEGILFYNVTGPDLPGEGVEVSTRLLGAYMAGTIAACFSVGMRLGVSIESIKKGIEELSPISHRLEYKKQNDGSILIDDSYNANITGIVEGITLLNRFKNYNKIYITPGLVEVGNDTERLHREIGKKLSYSVDKVVLIDTPPSRWIKQSLIEEGFNEDDIVMYPTMPTALTALAVERTSKDVVLIQNDWTENYE